MKNILIVVVCALSLVSCHEKKSVQRIQLIPKVLTDSIYTLMPGDLMFTGKHLVWSDPFTDSCFLHVLDLEGKELGQMGKSGQGPGEFVTPVTNRFCIDNSFFAVDANGTTKGYLSIDSLLEGKNGFIPLIEEKSRLGMSKMAQNVYYKTTEDGSEFYFQSCINGKISSFGVYPIREVKQHLGGYEVYDSNRGLFAYTSFTLPYLALYKKQGNDFCLLWDTEIPISKYDIVNGEIVPDRKQMGGGDIAISKDYIVVLQRDYATDSTDESTVGRDISKCPRTVFLYDFESHLVKIVDLGMPVMRIASVPDSNKLYVIGAYPDYVLAEYNL